MRRESRSVMEHICTIQNGGWSAIRKIAYGSIDLTPSPSLSEADTVLLSNVDYQEPSTSSRND